METTDTDTELVEAWRRGDPAALGAVYDRYAGAIHGFALARTRSAADAADILQDTFVRAASRVHQLREPERLRAWLFAIARRRVYDLAGRRDVVSARADDDRPSDDAPLDTQLVRDELHELVWAAAGSLNDRDRELLELHLRDGLEGADLAAVVGLAPSHVHTLVDRLRDRMAKAVGALLVARHARRACPALDGLLAAWDGWFTLDVRSRVTRHVEGCAVCTTERRTMLAPGWFSAGALALPVVLPPELRDSVLDAVRTPPLASGPHTGRDRAGDPWRHDGFPAVPRRQRHRRGVPRRWVSLGTMVAGLAVVVTALIVLAGRQDGGRAVVEVPASSAPVDTGSTAAGPPVPPGVPGTTAGPGAVAPAAVPPAGPVTTGTSAAGSGPTGASSPAQGADRQGSSPAGGVAVAPGESRPAPPSTTAGVATSTTAVVSPPPSTPSTPSSGGAEGAPGSTATTGPPAPPTAAPPAPPAALVLSTSSIALGASSSTATFSVSNQGGQAASLTTSSSSATLAVATGSATIAPGGSATLTVTLDRAAEAEGARTFTVSVAAPGATGGGQVVVTATVERAPTITNLARTPASVRTSTSCGQTLTRVSLDATDESGIASVSVLWSSDGVFGQRTPLSLDGSGHWTAQVGSFSVTGTRSLTVEVIDSRGNHANASTSVLVVAC